MNKRTGSLSPDWVKLPKAELCNHLQVSAVHFSNTPSISNENNITWETNVTVNEKWKKKKNAWGLMFDSDELSVFA